MMKKTVLFLLMAISLGLPMLNGTAVAQEKSPAPAPGAEMNFKNVDSMIVLFITKPEVISELVPKPLIPNEWNMMFLVIERTKRGGIDYNQMVVGIPVGYRGKMFSYYVTRIVDKEEISVQDQAASGNKTPVGRILFEKKDGKAKGVVELGGRVLASTDLALGKPGDPLDPSPGVFLVDSPPDVKQLLWATWENMKVNEALDGKTEMKLDKPIAGTALDIPVLAIFRGVCRNTDYTIKPQGVLYDYLKKKQAN
jgi:acetoacetate decarboxylase